MNNYDFTNKVALITGGGSGIGFATAKELSAQGTSVVIAGRSSERGEAAARELTGAGGEARFVQVDVGSDGEVERLISETLSAFGRLDFVFNNAGTEGALKPVPAWNDADCDELLATNVKGPYLVMKHASGAMSEQGGGVIVNTASFVGTVAPVPIAVLYGATKAALLSMTASAALAFAEQGVRVYAVCPWMTDTAMADRVSGGQAEVKAHLAGLNPSGAMASPEDVAGVVLDLLAEAAGLQSGASVLVDHGGERQRVPFPLTVSA